MNSQVISRFRELVKAGVIKEGLRQYAKGNIKFPVFNGGVFWDKIVSCQGWCIQQRKGPIHGPYDHYRILDPNDVRHAWGTGAYISRCIMSISLSSEDDQVFDCFDELVRSNRLLERLNAQASTNIEWGTMGGEVFWDTLHECQGWRIQQNKVFHNCRILAPDNVRYAWGSKKYIYRRIMGQPINLLVNYLRIPGDGDNSFAKYPTSASERKGSVILVHGWGCRAIAMEPPAKILTQFGYDAYCYDYQSALYSIPELGQKLLNNLKYLISQLPSGEKLYILTHSMGGLITRKALQLDTEYDGLGTRISQIVMLGPPNHGSLMADLAVLAGIGLVNASINDMRYLGEAAVKEIGKPACFNKTIGIIAGSRDLKVLPQDSVGIPGMTEGKDYKVIKVDASHPQLRTSFEALSQAMSFFETGEFCRNA